MAANGQGGDVKWQVLVNRLPVVVSILENPSTERKVAPASLESLKKLHDQAQALVKGQLVLPVTLDESQRKEVDECVAGIARCLDKFPLHLLLEASQPKWAKVLLNEPMTPAEGLTPLQRTASLPSPGNPSTVVVPTSKSEGPPEMFGLGLSPPRTKVSLPADDRGLEEVGWRPPEKFQKGFVPKHSDTGTTGLTSEVFTPEGVVLHPPPMHGRTARPLGAFGGMGVASKPGSYPPGRSGPAEGALGGEHGHALNSAAPWLRGLDLADPGDSLAKSPPKSSVLSGGRAGHEEFWENGWTTIASRDLRAEIATAELDLLKESDEARAVRLQAEREAEAAAKIVRAREARQLYAGLDSGIERMQMQRGGAKAGPETFLWKDSSSRSVEDSLSPHSSGAEADVDSQGLPGGYTDSGDKLALAGGDQRQNSFQSPRGGLSQGGALSPAARHRQQKQLLQRQLEEEHARLELRIANRTSGANGANGDHKIGPPKSARVPLGLSLWCGSGIEGGQDLAEGGSGSGQEDRDPSPQSPLAEKRKHATARQEWPEVGVLGLRKHEQHRNGGEALEAERSTPSPPVSLGLALQSGGRDHRMSNTDTLHGSVGQPLGSVGLGRLELGTSRETSDVERGVKRHKDWQEEAWVRSRGAGGQPHQHLPHHPHEERRKAGPREQAKRPRVDPSPGGLSPPPPRAAKAPQKARGFDYPAALRSSVEAFLAQSSGKVSREVGGVLNPSAPLWPPPDRVAKLAPPFTQQELVQREPPSRRIARPTPPAVVPEYPFLPPHVLNRGVPEIPLQGVPVYPHLFGGSPVAPGKVPPYPKGPLDPTVYPFGAVRAVPAAPYGALPPDWAAPFPPHVFAAGFDHKPSVMGGLNHGINPLGKSWADAVSRWQLPHERNGGVPEEEEEARSQSMSWPNSTPIVPGTSLQGVHSRPNSAPVHFSRGRKDPPPARGYYETHPEVFTLGRDQPPTTFPHRKSHLPGERPAHVRTEGDISSLMPSLDLNQPPPLLEGGKLVSPAGGYLDTDPYPPASKTRGQPGFVPPPFPHIMYPEAPMFPIELPVTEPSNLSPPPYGKPRVPPAFPMAHYPHVPYPLTVPLPRTAPDSSLYSNVHDPTVMDPGSFVLPVAYDYGALERPEGFVPPPPLQKLGYLRPPHLVAPVAYDPGQIAYDPACHPVPLHLQGAYPIPDPRSLNPSDPRVLGFFPVSWAADARIQGVKNSVLQVPPDTKELAWGDPREAAAGFARKGRPVRHYVATEKETMAVREKMRAMQAPPPPVPAPPAAFANYPTWDLRASPMLPFGRNLGLACDSSVASNVVRRTDSENDLTVLPGRGDEARVPTRNESLEEVAFARRRDLGSPVGDAVLGKPPVRSSRGAAHLTRLGEDPRGEMFVGEERFPRQYMQEQYLRGVEEGAKAAQWQRQCGSPPSTHAPVEPYAEDMVHRAVPSVSGTGVNKAGRHPEVRKKRSSDEATSKNSGEPETEQPPKKRSPNARTHAIGPRGLL